MGVKYKAAIVGCGRIGASYIQNTYVKEIPSHALAYFKEPRTNIIAAADIYDNRLLTFQKRWQTKRIYKDYRLMLKCELPDIVSICTPIDTHYDILKDIASRNVRAIWCEKPISDDIKKAEEMVDICKKKGIVLAVNYFRRWSALHKKVNNLIKNKKLGDIQQVICYYSKGILNNGSHIIDILHLFFGEIEFAHAQIDNPAGPQGTNDISLNARLWFKKGFPATLFAFDDKYFRIIEIDIIGTKGRIILKEPQSIFEYYRISKHPYIRGLKSLKTSNFPEVKYEPMQAMSEALDDILQCIQNKARPICSGEDAVMALRIVEAIKKSAARNGDRIRVKNN